MKMKSKEEIEHYRDLLKDKNYMKKAVENLAENLMEGNIKLEIYDEGEESKFCPYCRRVKMLDEFYISTVNAKGRYYMCKECKKTKNREAYMKRKAIKS